MEEISKGESKVENLSLSSENLEAEKEVSPTEKDRHSFTQYSRKSTRQGSITPHSNSYFSFSYERKMSSPIYDYYHSSQKFLNQLFQEKAKEEGYDLLGSKNYIDKDSLLNGYLSEEYYGSTYQNSGRFSYPMENDYSSLDGLKDCRNEGRKITPINLNNTFNMNYFNNEFSAYPRNFKEDSSKFNKMNERNSSFRNFYNPFINYVIRPFAYSNVPNQQNQTNQPYYEMEIENLNYQTQTPNLSSSSADSSNLFFNGNYSPMNQKNSFGGFNQNQNQNLNFQRKSSGNILPKKPKKFVEREGDWICKSCKNLNFSFRKMCNRCGAQKGEDSQVITKEIIGNLRRDQNYSLNEMDDFNENGTSSSKESKEKDFDY